MNGWAAPSRGSSSQPLGLPTAISPGDLTGAAPYVHLEALDADRLQAEVSSNAFLDPRLRLSEVAERELAALGWHAPGFAVAAEEVSENFVVQVPVSDAGWLARLVVDTVRGTFGEAAAFLPRSSSAAPLQRDRQAG